MNCLTRITIGKSQAAALKLGDAYAWHQKLWEAFPGRDGETRDFLFRVDNAGPDFRVFMLSEAAPKPPVWGLWEPKQIADSFLEHSDYRFQLRANPTMRRSSDGRRLGIYAENRLDEWINRKAEQNGFDIVADTLVIGAPVDEFFGKKGRRGKHVAVDFFGALSVSDRESFSHAFNHGIGSAKAFGFGLLMLEPLN